jgi:hypothetical protein
MNITQAICLALAAVTLPTACNDKTPTGPDYNPDVPSTLTSTVTNPFFPLAVGSVLTYEGMTDEGLETIVVEVMPGTRNVNGVAARIVRDRVYLEGDLIEDTFDWYAQDAAGNVWYLGEDSKEIENGTVVSTEGSWEWGEDGALPGIIMWAEPSAHIGEEYRQEYYEGEAEDWGKVLATGRSVNVPAGNLPGCVEVEEWNALEANSTEKKFFCPQLGFALEITADGELVELMTVSTP